MKTYEIISKKVNTAHKGPRGENTAWDLVLKSNTGETVEIPHFMCIGDPPKTLTHSQIAGYIEPMAGFGFVLRRKSDGWFVAPGSKHTSAPNNAILFGKDEVEEFLAEWGSNYEIVNFSEAREVQ